MIKCVFTSEWDHDYEITSNCEYDPETGAVYPEIAEDEPENGSILTGEFIMLPKGKIYDVCQECHSHVLKHSVDFSNTTAFEMTTCTNPECDMYDLD